MLIGANPRREAAVLNARIRKRCLQGNVAIGADRREGRSHLYLRLISAPGRRRLAQVRRPAAPAKAKSRCSSSGRARSTAPDGAAVLAMAAQGGGVARRRQGWLERLQHAAQRSGAASARSISALCRARAAWIPPACSKAGALDVLFLLGADEIDVRARRFRRLYRHAWRPRRAPRRRHPAGRGLSGEVRHSTSTPKAACRWPSRAAFPPGDAREDWAILRALSDALGHKLPYDSLARSAPALFAAHPHLMRIGQIAPGDAADIGKLAKLGGYVGQGGVRVRRRRLLFDQSDRARVRRHGGMFGARACGSHRTAAE